MCKVGDVVVALFLTILAYRDWKTKQVSLGLILGMALSVIVLRITVVEVSLWTTIWGIVIGVGFFVVSKCTRQAIGYGDSWAILLLGIYLGWKELLLVIFVSSLLASLFSVVYCMIRGWNRKYTIPFIPFLAVAYYGVVLW